MIGLTSEPFEPVPKKRRDRGEYQIMQTYQGPVQGEYTTPQSFTTIQRVLLQYRGFTTIEFLKFIFSGGPVMKTAVC